jgi:hypothetical protein
VAQRSGVDEVQFRPSHRPAAKRVGDRFDIVDLSGGDADH